jgi:hypothetical protein
LFYQRVNIKIRADFLSPGHYLFGLFPIKGEKMRKRVKIFLILLLVFGPFYVIRAQIEEDFGDGNFTQNPVWLGEENHFKINNSNQLQTKGESADTFFLATQNNHFGHTEWMFWIKMSFNTSANNNCRIYLASGTQDLEGLLEGYLIQVGGKNDSISFCKQDGENIVSLFHFPGYQTNQTVNQLRFKVIRSIAGQWDFWLDAAGGDQFTYQGGVHDVAHTTAQWFGIFCQVTSSNTSKVYFDEIYVGPERLDTLAPWITAFSIMDSVRLNLRFSETMDAITILNTNNYVLLSRQKHPAEVLQDPWNENQVILRFSQPFQRQTTDTLSIKGIQDLAGNTISDTLISFAWFEAEAWDVLIHEVMMDPEPVVGLPPAEYVELLNTTSFPVSLDGWQFEFGNTIKTIHDAIITPEGYLLLVKDTALVSYGPVHCLFTSNTSLTNSGTTLTLYDTNHHVIHSMTIDPAWITSDWKTEGGWSLEMMDQNNPCGCSDNWQVSSDPSGGTPGARNSVQVLSPDNTPPQLKRGFLRDSITWELVFSEGLDTLGVGTTDQWILDKQEIHPVAVDPVEPAYKAIQLRFETPFQPGILYTLSSTHQIADCVGNTTTDPVVSEAAIPLLPDRESLLFNELLFDPYPDASRFIELYNNTTNVIDLSSVGLCSMDQDSSINTSGAKQITLDPFLLFPGSYVAICDEIELVTNFYHVPFPNQLVQAVDFPKMTNDGGRLVLIRLHDESMIDMVDYQASMHYPLLVSTEGVSLERIRFDRPTRDPDNWHSAAFLVGYATPGYENSQYRNTIFESSEPDQLTIEIIPPAFSPDNDGHEDIVEINCRCVYPGGQLGLMVFDARGRFMTELASNILAGSSNQFLWDGINDDGYKVPVGIYVLYVEYVHPSGKVLKEKKPLVVVTGR